MSGKTNTTLSALATALQDVSKTDLDALITALTQGAGVVTVQPKVKKRTVTYTKTDGTTVLATPKQAKAWAQRSTGRNPESVARSEQFLTDMRARAQAREAAGLPTKRQRRFANRAAAEMVRKGLSTNADTTRDGILAGTVQVPADITAYATK